MCVLGGVREGSCLIGFVCASFERFSQELMWRKKPDGKELLGIVDGWQHHCNRIQNGDV